MIKLIINPSKYMVQDIYLNQELLDAHSGIRGYKPGDCTSPYGAKCIIGVQVETGKTIGMLTIKSFTNKVAEIHIFVLPEMQGRGLTGPFFDAFMETIVKPSNYNTVMTYTPACCTKVIEALKSRNFKITHTIQDGIEYFNKLEDLHFMEYSRKEFSKADQLAIARELVDSKEPNKELRRAALDELTALSQELNLDM